MLQKRFDEREIPSQHSRMQWGVADGGRVRVGTVLQQKRTHGAVATMSGHDQRGRAVRQCLVRTGSGGQQ